MKKVNVLLVLLLSLSGLSCSKSQNPGDDVATPHSDAFPGHGMMVLGEKLEDPYTVENMTRAFLNLYPDTKAAGDIISTTHYYVRFLPKNEAECNNLEGLGADLVDHPVDYRVIRDGDYYHDPSIPDDEITWQYAVVPPDFHFPRDIPYQILDRCHIAEQEVVTRSGIRYDMAAVEEEAFRITGNAGMAVSAGSNGSGAWTKSGDGPSGRITILDEDYDPEPIGVAGVRVSCNVFVKFCNAVTDESGYYTMDRTFSKDPHYRLVFKNVNGFSIGFNLIFVPASCSTLGKGSPEGISAVIDKNSDRALFSRCVVNNAGYDYFKFCQAGDPAIPQPPVNLRLWLFQKADVSSAVMLQQGVLVDSSIISDLLGPYFILLKMFLPDIMLGLKDADGYADIYGLAIHEMAHASHYMIVGNDYWEAYCRYILTSFVTSGFMVYGVGNEENHGFCEVGEIWGYYMQNRFWRNRYPSDPRSFGTSHWFRPQILMYMDERGVDAYRIAQALGPDITSLELLQEKLLSLYPESKSIIKQAFERYR